MELELVDPDVKPADRARPPDGEVTRTRPAASRRSYASCCGPPRSGKSSWQTRSFPPHPGRTDHCRPRKGGWEEPGTLGEMPAPAPEREKVASCRVGHVRTCLSVDAIATCRGYLVGMCIQAFYSRLCRMRHAASLLAAAHDGDADFDEISDDNMGICLAGGVFTVLPWSLARTRARNSVMIPLK